MRTKLRLVVLAGLLTTGVQAAEVFNGALTFDTQNQSLWSSGAAFQFGYQDFFGITADPSPFVINPAVRSGTVPPFGASWSVDPYFQFDSNLRAGIGVGANVTGGSIDASLGYTVSLNAPGTIVKGQAFSLAGSALQSAASSFSVQSPNASAYVDGILQIYLGGYMRFVTSGLMGDHDYRMGRLGFTDGSTSNTPYRTLANVDRSPEIVSVNRNDSGQLRVLGTNQGGIGSQYQLGSTTITAGDWRVAPNGAYDGNVVRGSDQKTLLTAALDVDQLAMGGVPALGTGVAHDWGVIAMDFGYEIVDLTATLQMGLRQNLSLQSSLLVQLLFSEEVLVGGVPTMVYNGPLDAMPQITLLTDSVTVTPSFAVAAQLLNDTDLTVDATLALIAFEGHAYADYDFSYFGSRSGVVVDQSFGPMYEWSTSMPLFDVDVYGQQFVLGGFQMVEGESFVLTAVPEPRTYALLLAGLVVLVMRARRRVSPR